MNDCIEGKTHCYHALLNVTAARASAVCCWCGGTTENWMLPPQPHGQHAPGIQTANVAVRP